MAAVDKAGAVNPLDWAKIFGLMVGYDVRWGAAGWTTLELEQTYQLPIVNPKTGRKSNTFSQAGKLDGVVEFSGRRYILEHKTTSEDVSDPSSPYWQRLAIDAQVSAYVLSQWQAGTKPDGTLYDVIRKPTIRPKTIPAGKPGRDEAANLGTLQELAGGTYFGFAVGEEPIGTEETPELFARRLAYDTAARPQFYFARRVISRLDQEVVEWAQELYDVSQSIAHARKHNAHYKNSSACMLYGSACEYLPLCSGHDTASNSRWTTAPETHAELAGIWRPENALTFSRVKCFQTCRKKHWYRYEQRIVRADAEEREPLRFGSLFHAALEAWWNCFAKDSSNGNGSRLAATEVASETGAQELVSGS